MAMNENPKKANETAVTILIIIIFLIFGVIIAYLLKSEEGSIQQVSGTIEAQKDENVKSNDNVPQNIQDKLENKTFTILDTLNKFLGNEDDISNVEFEFLGCFYGDDLYEVCYIVYDDEEITGSQFKFYYSKEDYKLVKTIYIYSSQEVSVGKVLDETIHICILGYLPFSIDPVAFYSNTVSDILSMYGKMYENGYTFLSDYKISVEALANTLLVYEFQKID